MQHKIFIKPFNTVDNLVYIFNCIDLKDSDCKVLALENRSKKTMNATLAQQPLYNFEIDRVLIVLKWKTNLISLTNKLDAKERLSSVKLLYHYEDINFTCPLCNQIVLLENEFTLAQTVAKLGGPGAVKDYFKTLDFEVNDEDA